MIRKALVFAVSAPVALVVATPASAAAHLRTLYSFCPETGCTDGQEPSDGLAVDARGNLFGTTELGGDANKGVAFELVKDAHGTFTYSRLYSFCAADACTDGALPLSGVVLDARGNVYGTTRLGGASNVGTVFELSSNGGGWTYTVLHSFCANCTDGANPNGLTLKRPTYSPGVVVSSPSIYGTTYHGGDAAGGTGSGTVFQLTNLGGVWTESVLYAFCQSGCATGANPGGKLLLNSDGSITGTTVGGGASSGGGVVFNLAHGGAAQWNATVLYTFCATGNCPDGATPFANVVRDPAGILYGTTGSGGATNAGTLYQLAYDGTQWNETVLYSFCARKNCADGKQPQSQLYLDKTGALFGTAFQGGGAGAGVIFKWFNGTFGRPYSFCQRKDCADGKYAAGTLAADRQGNLYGATFSGGAFGQGTIFEYVR